MSHSPLEVKSYYPRSLCGGSPTGIDLFCGAGGLSLGFCQAGGRPIAAVDNDLDSITTYRRMFPICGDFHHGPIENWIPHIERDRVDVVMGGPPCQGFSTARGLRFVDHPKNHLYKEFVRIVNELHPQWFVMENVPGLLSIGKGVILKQIHEDFQRVGYWVESRVVNLADYGVPQTRRRAIFVGSRTARSFEWPVPTHAKRRKSEQRLFDIVDPYVSVGDALSDLPWPLGKYIAHRANSQMRGPRNRDLWSEPSYTLRVRGDEFGILNAPTNGVFAAYTPVEQDIVYTKATNTYQELMREEPPPWLLDDYQTPRIIRRQPGALEAPRRLAIREQARLQSFPDWFVFSGTDYSQGRQIGNAVPPLYAKSLFLHIFSCLEDGK